MTPASRMPQCKNSLVIHCNRRRPSHWVRFNKEATSACRASGIPHGKQHDVSRAGASSKSKHTNLSTQPSNPTDLSDALDVSSRHLTQLKINKHILHEQQKARSFVMKRAITHAIEGGARA